MFSHSLSWRTSACQFSVQTQHVSASGVSADRIGDLRVCWCCWSLVQSRWNSQQWFLKSPQPSAGLTWPKRRKPGGYALLDQLGEWKTIWHSARESYTLLSKHFACQYHRSTKGQRERQKDIDPRNWTNYPGTRLFLPHFSQLNNWALKWINQHRKVVYDRLQLIKWVSECLNSVNQWFSFILTAGTGWKTTQFFFY